MTTIRATAKRDLEAGVFVTAADVAIIGAPIRPMPTWPVGLARAEHFRDRGGSRQVARLIVGFAPWPFAILEIITRKTIDLPSAGRIVET